MSVRLPPILTASAQDYPPVRILMEHMNAFVLMAHGEIEVETAQVG